MKKANPISSLLMITVTICVLMGALPIIALIEGGNQKDDFDGFTFVFLGMSMMVIYSTVKSIDRRLANIERQMKHSGQ